MQGVMYAARGTLFTFLMTVLGAALVFCFRGRMEARAQRGCLGFAAGVMAAAAVFSLLLPAMEQAQAAAGGAAVMTVTLGFLMGAGAMLAADAWARRRLRAADEAQRARLLMVTAVTLHNIPEGMAVGLAFALAAQERAAFAAACALALGVGVQNFPEGAAVSLPLRRGGMSRRKSFLWGVVSGAVEPVSGVAAVLFASLAAPAMPMLMAFSAGAMMLVVVMEMIPEAAGERWGVGFVMLGYALMMALDLGFGQ